MSAELTTVVSYFFDEDDVKLYCIKNGDRQQQRLCSVSLLKPVFAIEEIYKTSNALGICKGTLDVSLFASQLSIKKTGCLCPLEACSQQCRHPFLSDF